MLRIRHNGTRFRILPHENGFERYGDRRLTKIPNEYDLQNSDQFET